MTILVTGGAGFIGSNFILGWLENSPEPVVNLDKLTYAGNLENLAAVARHPRYSFVQADICDEAAVAAVFADRDIRAVVHFAAESHVDRSIHGPEAFLTTNVMGTFRLLEAARRHWIRDGAAKAGTRFLHVSTDEVYGSLAAGEAAFSETHAYQPNSPYSASKAASDHIARAYFHTYGLPVLMTNCSNNYGPYHFPEKLIPLVIHNALSGRDLPVYGDGRQVRDWLYVQDHCTAIRQVLEKGRLGEKYNIGGGTEKTNIDVVRAICALLDTSRPRDDGRSYAAQITFVTDRPGHDRRYAIDATKIETELGWRPVETFETGLAKTVRWYLDNPGWVERTVSGAYRHWLETQYA